MAQFVCLTAFFEAAATEAISSNILKAGHIRARDWNAFLQQPGSIMTAIKPIKWREKQHGIQDASDVRGVHRNDESSGHRGYGRHSKHSSDVHSRRKALQKEQRMAQGLTMQLHSLDRGMELLARFLKLLQAMSRLTQYELTQVGKVEGLENNKKNITRPDLLHLTSVLRYGDMDINMIMTHAGTALCQLSRWWAEFDRHWNHTSATQNAVGT